MARLAFGTYHAGGKATRGTVSQVAPSSATPFVILDVDMVATTSHTALRQAVLELLKQFEGQMAP